MSNAETPKELAKEITDLICSKVEQFLKEQCEKYGVDASHQGISSLHPTIQKDIFDRARNFEMRMMNAAALEVRRFNNELAEKAKKTSEESE